VVLDTLRKDHFEEHFSWLPGQRYENTVSPSHWTVPVHASMFTGKYPSEHGIYAGSEKFDYENEALIEQLNRDGYRTRGISTNINISSWFNFDRGFNDLRLVGYQQRNLKNFDPNLYDWRKFSRESKTNSLLKYPKGVWNCIRSDCRTVQSIKYGLEIKYGAQNPSFEQSRKDMGSAEVLDIIKTMDFSRKNEFLYLNLMESHKPYKTPYTDSGDNSIDYPDNPVGKIDSTTDIKNIHDLYDNAVKYLSEIYEKIFDELVTDMDYIITVSDHGELLGEHGYCRHAYGLFPELTQVPLSIYSGEDNVIRREELVSLIDIYDTVLAMANIAKSNNKRQIHNSGYNQRKLLTEYHGIPHPRKAKMESLIDWAGSENQYQELLRGVYLPDSVYAYEHNNNVTVWGSTGKNDVNYSGIIDDLVKDRGLPQKVDLDRDTMGDNGLPSNVEERLNDLGYR